MRHALTTIDNPYDPLDDYARWYAYDEAAGYHTGAYLARVVSFSSELSDLDQELAIEQAIDEIVEFNILGIYRKVSKPYDE